MSIPAASVTQYFGFFIGFLPSLALPRSGSTGIISALPLGRTPLVTGAKIIK
jgi:hypothetical protein